MKKIYLILPLLFAFNLIHAKDYKLLSPDGQLSLNLNINEVIKFSVSLNNECLIDNSQIGIEIEGVDSGKSANRISKVLRKSNDDVIRSFVPNKDALIKDQYNELTIRFRNRTQLTFRAYNDGIAYRFGSSLNKSIVVKDEILNLQFGDETDCLFPKEESLVSHYERMYKAVKLHELQESDFCSLPVLMKVKEANVLLTESGVSDYPHMFMHGTRDNGLQTKFPGVVTKAVPYKEGADRDQKLTSADYVAETDGKRNFPWRVFVISKNDKDLVESNLAFQLAEPNKIEDPSWIKPGKVAWDWYNANNIYGVDFKAGINTDTYKYYIDFAAEYGLEYIILDEGWSETTTKIDAGQKDIDIEELVAYGNKKNVGIILWVLWGPLDKDLEEILALYESWGIKGVKVDFMQRADQYMVNYYERVAKVAAKHHLLVDFHGSFKPAGLRRKYPNVLSYEGLKGNENHKWSQLITPEHNVTLPFTRMVAGPMDYTPGSMINCHLKNHKISFGRPESIGTRSHQVAMYVVYESPLQMLCESPSTYYKEDETTRFIAEIPTVWDETRVLDAKVADYIMLARRKHDTWFVGAMTDNSSRDLTLDLSFLDAGNYEMQLMIDGPNAHRHAQDYQIKTFDVNASFNKAIELASGGGFVAIIKKKR